MKTSHLIVLFCVSAIQSIVAIEFSQTVYYTGSAPHAAVGDFNGDGYSDIVQVRSSMMRVLLGSETGQFTMLPQIGTVNALCVATADVNRDGKLDLLVPNYTSETLYVYAGNGDGTFGAAASYAGGVAVTSLNVADFNSDGRLDVVLPNTLGTKSISILLAKATGGFGTVTNFGTTIAWYAGTGDFNRDGKLDVVTANGTNATISIFQGQGNGAFIRTTNYAVQPNARTIAVNDFNEDSILDLAVACDTNAVVSVLMGRGNGTFSNAVHYPAGAGAFSVSAADMNADSKLDLVVATTATNGIAFLLGIGDGTFQSPVFRTLPTATRFAVIADFDKDGAPDLAANYHTGGGNLYTLFNLTPFPQPTISMSWLPSQHLLLTWPSSAMAYRMECSSALDSDWASITNVPISLGSRYFLTNSLDGGQKFFRLNP